MPKARMLHGSSGERRVKMAWPYKLKVVDLPLWKAAYLPNKKMELLPELLTSEIIESCDPRLSCTLKTDSVYRLPSAPVKGNDDEIWFEEDASGQYQMEANKLKVKIHVNPKFLLTAMKDSSSSSNVLAPVATDDLLSKEFSSDILLPNNMKVTTSAEVSKNIEIASNCSASNLVVSSSLEKSKVLPLENSTSICNQSIRTAPRYTAHGVSSSTSENNGLVTNMRENKSELSPLTANVTVHQNKNENQKELPGYTKVQDTIASKMHNNKQLSELANIPRLSRTENYYTTCFDELSRAVETKYAQTNSLVSTNVHDEQWLPAGQQLSLAMVSAAQDKDCKSINKVACDEMMSISHSLDKHVESASRKSAPIKVTSTSFFSKDVIDKTHGKPKQHDVSVENTENTPQNEGRLNLYEAIQSPDRFDEFVSAISSAENRPDDGIVSSDDIIKLNLPGLGQPTNALQQVVDRVPEEDRQDATLELEQEIRNIEMMLARKRQAYENRKIHDRRSSRTQTSDRIECGTDGFKIDDVSLDLILLLQDQDNVRHARGDHEIADIDILRANTMSDIASPNLSHSQQQPTTVHLLDASQQERQSQDYLKVSEPHQEVENQHFSGETTMQGDVDSHERKVNILNGDRILHEQNHGKASLIARRLDNNEEEKISNDNRCEDSKKLPTDSKQSDDTDTVRLLLRPNKFHSQYRTGAMQQQVNESQTHRYISDADNDALSDLVIKTNDLISTSKSLFSCYGEPETLEQSFACESDHDYFSDESPMLGDSLVKSRFIDGIHALSSFTSGSPLCDEHNLATEKLVKREENSFFANLEIELDNTLPAILRSQYLHLNSLSIDTLLEGQFYECPTVKRIHFDTLRDWTKNKALEMIQVGHCADVSPVRNPLMCRKFDSVNLLTTYQRKRFLNKIDQTLTEVLPERYGAYATAKIDRYSAADTISINLFTELQQHLEFVSSRSIAALRQSCAVVNNSDKQAAESRQLARGQRSRDQRRSSERTSRKMGISDDGNTGVRTKTVPSVLKTVGPGAATVNNPLLSFTDADENISADTNKSQVEDFQENSKAAFLQLKELFYSPTQLTDLGDAETSLEQNNMLKNRRVLKDKIYNLRKLKEEEGDIGVQQNIAKKRNSTKEQKKRKGIEDDEHTVRIKKPKEVELKMERGEKRKKDRRHSSKKSKKKQKERSRLTQRQKRKNQHTRSAMKSNRASASKQQLVNADCDNLMDCILFGPEENMTDILYRIPSVAEFSASQLTPNSSYLWALNLAVSKLDLSGPADENIVTEPTAEFEIPDIIKENYKKITLTENMLVNRTISECFSAFKVNLIDFVNENFGAVANDVANDVVECQEDPTCDQLELLPVVTHLHSLGDVAAQLFYPSNGQFQETEGSSLGNVNEHATASARHKKHSTGRKSGKRLAHSASKVSHSKKISHAKKSKRSKSNKYATIVAESSEICELTEASVSLESADNLEAENLCYGLSSDVQQEAELNYSEGTEIVQSEPQRKGPTKIVNMPAKNPKFMQTFRLNQLAKKKQQREIMLKTAPITVDEKAPEIETVASTLDSTPKILEEVIVTEPHTVSDQITAPVTLLSPVIAVPKINPIIITARTTEEINQMVSTQNGSLHPTPLSAETSNHSETIPMDIVSSPQSVCEEEVADTDNHISSIKTPEVNLFNPCASGIAAFHQPLVSSAEIFHNPSDKSSSFHNATVTWPQAPQLCRPPQINQPFQTLETNQPFPSPNPPFQPMPTSQVFQHSPVNQPFQSSQMDSSFQLQQERHHFPQQHASQQVPQFVPHGLDCHPERNFSPSSRPSGPMMIPPQRTSLDDWQRMRFRSALPSRPDFREPRPEIRLAVRQQRFASPDSNNLRPRGLMEHPPRTAPSRMTLEPLLPSDRPTMSGNIHSPHMRPDRPPMIAQGRPAIAPARIPIIAHSRAMLRPHGSESLLSVRSVLVGKGFQDVYQPGRESSGPPAEVLVVALEFPVGSNHRVYVFNEDNPICHSVKWYLEKEAGQKLFDPNNIIALRAVPNIDCLVFIQQCDVARIQHIPNFLRLKRDLRVKFLIFNSLMDINVKQPKLRCILPKGGLVLIDNASLIDSNPGVLEKLCEFMTKQTKEKFKPWCLFMSSDAVKKLNKLREHFPEESPDNQRLRHIAQVIVKFSALQMIRFLPLLEGIDLRLKYPLSSLDYQACCLSLQQVHMNTYRHFLFITDMPRMHPDVHLFVESGIDVMAMADFMKNFVATPSIEHYHRPNQCTDYDYLKTVDEQNARERIKLPF